MATKRSITEAVIVAGMYSCGNIICDFVVAEKYAFLAAFFSGALAVVFVGFYKKKNNCPEAALR